MVGRASDSMTTLENSSATRHFRASILRPINSKRIVRKPSFHAQFKKMIKYYKRVGYSMGIMWQSACQSRFIAMVSSLSQA